MAMQPLSRETLRLLAQAAALRACAFSWQAVARRVGRREQTCRRWPQKYRAEWDRLYRAAEDCVWEAAAAEAAVVLARGSEGRR
jgi:hypothetical protein